MKYAKGATTEQFQIGLFPLARMKTVVFLCVLNVMRIIICLFFKNSLIYLFIHCAVHSSGESSKVFNLKTEPYLLCNHCEEFKPVKTFKLQNEVTCSICRNNGLDSDGCAMCDSCFRKTKSPSIAKKRKRKGANGTKAKGKIYGLYSNYILEVEGDKKSNNDSESQSELKSANIRKKIKRDETNEPKGEEVVSYNKEDITDDSDFDQSKAEDTTDDVVDFSEEKASSFEEVDGDDIDDEEEEEEEEENEEEEEEEVDSDDREHMEDNRPEDEIEDEEITKYVNEKKRARGEKVYEDGEPGDTLKPLPSCELKISDIIEEVDEKKGTESTHIMVNNPILKIDIGDFEKGTKLNYLEYNTKNKNLLLVKEDGKPQKFQLEIYVKATPINLM